MRKFARKGIHLLPEKKQKNAGTCLSRWLEKVVKTDTTKVDDQRLSQRYATSADFCRVFNDDMDHLYACAFLLLADHTQAEQCFVKSLEDCLAVGPVFSDWAERYARRTMVK